jgi:predicted transposase YbfD/YdcC
MKLTKEELLESLREGLARIPDPRRNRGVRHSLADILTVVVLGSMCNCDSVEEIGDWSNDNSEWLLPFIKCPHGLPSADTILRVLAVMCPKAFDEALADWVSKFRQSVQQGQQRQIAIDGKTLRGSGDRADDKRPAHLLSAFVTETGLALMQEVIDAKENEIIAIPELLDRLNLKETTVSIDAMGCQRAIAEQIVKQGGDYLLAVKENQPTLYADGIAYFNWALTNKHPFDDVPPTVRSASSTDAGHGRIEVRTAYVLPIHKYLSTRREWRGLAGIGMVESQRTDKLSGKTGGLERRYFIFSDEHMTPAHLLRQSRAHWAIENGLHWTLDVVFREDGSQVRTKNAAANLSLARKTALNLLRASPLKMSLRRKRSACARRPERVLDAIAASF